MDENASEADRHEAAEREADEAFRVPRDKFFWFLAGQKDPGELMPLFATTLEVLGWQTKADFGREDFMRFSEALNAVMVNRMAIDDDPNIRLAGRDLLDKVIPLELLRSSDR